MLRRLIENRERSLHGRDNNRKSLPFEWGTEHVGIQNTGNQATLLKDYVSRALADSSRFYFCEPNAAYDLHDEILRFPSAIETPYPENNTVWGRFFPAGTDLAVVVLQMGRASRALPRPPTRWNYGIALESALPSLS
jgi:hypothetical protein